MDAVNPIKIMWTDAFSRTIFEAFLKNTAGLVHMAKVTFSAAVQWRWFLVSNIYYVSFILYDLPQAIFNHWL